MLCNHGEKTDGPVVLSLLFVVFCSWIFERVVSDVKFEPTILTFMQIHLSTMIS